MTDRLSLSVCLFFVYLCLSTMPDLPSARPCLPDKVLRRYSIGCDQDLEIQIYFSATSFVWNSNKCVHLTDTRDIKNPLSCSHDEIRESSTTIGAEETALGATRRDPYCDLVRKKSLPDFRRLDVFFLPSS